MRAFRIAASVFGASALAEDAANIAIPTTSQYPSRILTSYRPSGASQHVLSFMCPRVRPSVERLPRAAVAARAEPTAPAPAADTARRDVGTGLPSGGRVLGSVGCGLSSTDPSGSILESSSVRSICSTPLFAMIFARFA
ncbi:putative secreted protein [Sorangium cellulosum So ce56]|uniref:Secreted protein n=1 Tax=Sorangium cellulosum (strain So ce56) TaxID=448385 RepID=A9GH16_SORC5|nr:putative secreted protein [Sorangium cellulosum So ce56]